MLDSPPRSKIAPRTPGWFAGNPPQPKSTGWGRVSQGDTQLVTYAANRTGLSGWVTDLIGTDSKTDVLNSLSSAKGVLILFAQRRSRWSLHTGRTKTDAERRARPRLASESSHCVAPKLRGQQTWRQRRQRFFGQELKKSRATAVWSYGQKVDAGEASSAAVKFLENIRSGKTPIESFRSIIRDPAVKAGPEVHLKVQLQRWSISGSRSSLLPRGAWAISEARRPGPRPLARAPRPPTAL